MRGAAVLLAVLLPGAALALEVPLPPGATLQAEDRAARAAPAFPEGPWAGGPPPLRAARDAAVTRRAWRVTAEARTDVLMDGVRTVLEAQGFRVVFACADRACGGYDFRFALDLLPAPEMYVDLGNYRYLLAEADDGARLVAVVTSRGPVAGYVHVTVVEPAAVEAGPPPDPEPPGEAASGAAPEAPPEAAPEARPETRPEADPLSDDLARRLAQDGHAVLEGLAFTTGAAALAEDVYPSLRALARFLEENPGARMVLVGHTDAVGALDTNVRLSKARAAAVRSRLVGTYGADGTRIGAEGAGYLAPVATNLTPEGRAANRRVEVVLLSND